MSAAQKDAVLQASIDFIASLTGMKPPPIEIAPAETFRPFKEFADKVCAIFAAPQAVNAQDQQDAQRYRYLRDTKMLDQWIWDALEHTEGDEYGRGLDASIDAAIAKAVKP